METEEKSHLNNLSHAVPPWLTRITQRMYEESRLFPSAINHVLINEYLPNQGIMPHQDGPAYFPVVAILSLGSRVVMDFTPHPSLTNSVNTVRNNVEDTISTRALENESEKLLDSYDPFSVVLMPCSLLIFKDKAYSDYLHGIKDCEVQHFNGAVNVAETLKFLRVNQSPPPSEKVTEEKRTADSVHRTTSRISLTCRVVSKVHKNLFKF
ncbi:unnamed protein product [Ilex paraguariensis]|uniref:Alpha-ketoglutarate-dependent dioxygenase AlkB-like domain-containing protein n=1 Tax=Ilex paraguariensis TaxID=185542 RepID=A0ABC8REE9_9AQUA